MIKVWSYCRHRQFGESVYFYPFQALPLAEPMHLAEVHIHDAVYPAQIIPALATLLTRSTVDDWGIMFERNGYDWIIMVTVRIGDYSVSRATQDMSLLTSEEIRVQLIALISVLSSIINSNGHSVDLWGQVVNWRPTRISKCPMEVFHVFH